MIIVMVHVRDSDTFLRRCDTQQQMWDYLRKFMEHRLHLESGDLAGWDDDPRQVVDRLFALYDEGAWYDWNWVDYIPHVLEVED